MNFQEWFLTNDALEAFAGCNTDQDRLRAAYDAGRSIGRCEGAGGAVVSFPAITDDMLEPVPSNMADLNDRRTDS